jgi:hypothetical protein
VCGERVGEGLPERPIGRIIGKGKREKGREEGKRKGKRKGEGRRGRVKEREKGEGKGRGKGGTRGVHTSKLQGLPVSRIGRIIGSNCHREILWNFKTLVGENSRNFV